MKLFKPIIITTPTDFALERSIKNNIFFYYVALFAWVGFMLYAVAYKEEWLLFEALLFFMSAINFNLSQKIDKARLENLRK